MKNNPFADLGKQLGLPASEGVSPSDADQLVQEEAAKPPGTHAPTNLRTYGPSGPGPARAVVRMERSGRGGKEATVVEQLGLSAAELDGWLKALKAALGCGGSIEGDSLMLQGDHRKRLPAVLKDRGVRKVIVG
jgi:translation initiation factor 1